MLCLLLYHYPNLTLGLHRNLFSVPVDLQLVRPVELLALIGSDQLSVQLRMPPTSSMPQVPPRCVRSPSISKSNESSNILIPHFQSNVKRPIFPVQSNKIHSLLSSRKFAGLLKTARPIESIVRSNAKRLVRIKRPVKSLSKPSSQISTKCPLKQFSLPIYSGSIFIQSQTTKNQKLLIYFGHSMRLQVCSRFTVRQYYICS